MAKKGDIIVVHAVRAFDLCATNDVGGTTFLPSGHYRVRLEKSWNDHEIGRRCVGTLLDAKDIETSRKVGTTPHSPKVADFQPKQVFFASTAIETITTRVS